MHIWISLNPCEKCACKLRHANLPSQRKLEIGKRFIPTKSVCDIQEFDVYCL